MGWDVIYIYVLLDIKNSETILYFQSCKYNLKFSQFAFHQLLLKKLFNFPYLQI